MRNQTPSFSSVRPRPKPALWCARRAEHSLEPGSAPRSVAALPAGATLHWVEHGRDDGEPVVLLHGYTDSSLSFARLTPLLPESARVFALDQRGHGKSPKDLASYAMADFTADVAAFLDARQIDRATLVGHSMGSLVAQRVAIEHPHRVARLVLIGSMTAGSNPATRELIAAVHRLADPVDPEFVRAFQRATLFAPVPEEFFARVVAESLAVPARVWREALASFAQQDTAAELHRIRAPTLILWGEHDAFFPRADQETLDRFITDSTFQILPGVGHAPHWEQPERVAAELAGFFRAHAAGTAAIRGTAARSSARGSHSQRVNQGATER